MFDTKLNRSVGEKITEILGRPETLQEMNNQVEEFFKENLTTLIQEHVAEQRYAVRNAVSDQVNKWVVANQDKIGEAVNAALETSLLDDSAFQSVVQARMAHFLAQRADEAVRESMARASARQERKNRKDRKTKA